MAKTLEEFKEEMKKAPLSGLIRKLIILESGQNDALKILPKEGQMQGERHISYDELKNIVGARYTHYIRVISEILDAKEKDYIGVNQ